MLNMMGFIFVGVALILIVSFLNIFQPSQENGRLLERVNGFLIEKFSGLSVFIPLLLLMFSGHFFNTKKLKFIKFHITGGITLIFIALLGLLKSGAWGQYIFDSLSIDLTKLGATIILLVFFLIGLILFLDTSIDIFVIFIIKSLKALFVFMQHYLFRSFFTNKKRSDLKKTEKTEPVFIKDQKTFDRVRQPLSTLPVVSEAKLHTAASNSDFTIKPISPSSSTTWVYPPLNLLMDVAQKEAERGDVQANAAKIEATLESFGIRAKVDEVNYGPAVTQYALSITMGTKLSRITALSNDLALSLAASTGTVRIEAPIPGRSMVGIEIPNIRPEIVTLKKMLTSDAFTKEKDPLMVPLGLDVSGTPRAGSLAKMPHVLIAGATGSGKSVMLNAWITTFLFRTKPEELRLILVDPKRVELTLYNGIPHLLTEVIVEPEKIIKALRWTVGEMESRYKIFAQAGVRNLDGYNVLEGVEKKPYIIFVIDELADLMIFAARDAEELITRIAQMARATGIHLVLATQRPSVDVITGLMKANIPTRISFSVSSMIDSRVIIDMPGAEKLLGKGDMLYMPPDQAKPRRIQGPFLTEKEVSQLTKFLKSQNPEVHYTEEITEVDIKINPSGLFPVGGVGGSDNDPLFSQAMALVTQFDKASASLLQRRLSIGYARAARILDQLEAAGFVGPSEGSKPREVIKHSVASPDEIPVEEKGD